MDQRTSWWGPPLRGSPALLCFPHAGGGPASYVRLVGGLVPGCATVRLPGRPPRSQEPAPEDLRHAAAAVGRALVAAGVGPLALWGHSFGAVLAWEVAAELAAGAHPPALVVATGRNVPGRDRERRHLWSDDALLDFLRSEGGAPEVVLADPDMRSLVLAQLRTDLRLLAAYRPPPRPPLDQPLVVVGGMDDPQTTLSGLRDWAALTTGWTQVHEVPGGHFFPWEGSRFSDLLRDALRRALP